jgi:methylthioribose-1-phosphate isomerase
MAPLISIKSDDDKLEIVNQLLLPHTTQFIQINTIEDAHDAIKTMKVGFSPI